MKEIAILKDEIMGTYFISIDGKIEYECLAADEVTEVINELMEGETK